MAVGEKMTEARDKRKKETVKAIASKHEVTMQSFAISFFRKSLFLSDGNYSFKAYK